MNKAAFDPWSFSVTAKYRDMNVQFCLPDIARSVDPPLASEHILEQMTLAKFVPCFKEDLGIEGLQVELQFTHPNSSWPNMMKKDRQLCRAAAAD